MSSNQRILTSSIAERLQSTKRYINTINTDFMEHIWEDIYPLVTNYVQRPNDDDAPACLLRPRMIATRSQDDQHQFTISFTIEDCTIDAPNTRLDVITNMSYIGDHGTMEDPTHAIIDDHRHVMLVVLHRFIDNVSRALDDVGFHVVTMAYEQQQRRTYLSVTGTIDDDTKITIAFELSGVMYQILPTKDSSVYVV